MRADSSEFPVILTDSPPAFELRRADPKAAPEGVTYAGIVRLPNGEVWGIHAYVPEGEKRFIGGVFAVDPEALGEAAAEKAA